jgi:hypothetical protein
MTEQWASIPGWEGLYEVSDRGCVRSLDKICGARNGGKALRRGRVLSPVVKAGRYLAVTLADRAHRKQHFVHDLVLLAFVGEKPSGMQACHFDDVYQNNVLANLRYGTPKENTADAVRNNKKPRGSAHGCAKLTEADVLTIRNTPLTNREIARIYGIHPAHVYGIRTRKTWKHV